MERKWRFTYEDELYILYVLLKWVNTHSIQLIAINVICNDFLLIAINMQLSVWKHYIEFAHKYIVKYII